MKQQWIFQCVIYKQYRLFLEFVAFNIYWHYQRVINKYRLCKSSLQTIVKIPQKVTINYRTEFWDFTSNEINIFRKLLPDIKDLFSAFISNNTDVLGDSILFSEFTPNTTSTTKQNWFFFPFHFSFLSRS